MLKVFCFLPAVLYAIEIKRHTALTRPLTLNQGEVTNSFHTLEIPKGPIAVYRFEADVVEKDADGNIVPVPLFDAYLHHHVVGSGLDEKHYESSKGTWTPMKSAKISRAVGFGAGTESRGTPQKFNYPYAFLTVEGEDTWTANVHVINTREMTTARAHHCLECPCIDGNNWHHNGIDKALPWNMCNSELLDEHNTACSPNTYYGGLRCCEDGVYCLAKKDLSKLEQSTYYLRYTIEYADITPDNVPVYVASCCDATGDLSKHGAIEYDVPMCDEEIHPGCVHTLSTRQRLGGVDGGSVFGVTSGNTIAAGNDKEVELLFAVGHQHRAGMGISLYNDKTGDLICTSMPLYGKGTEMGNEKDMVVAMTTCNFDPPLRMRSSDILRVVALYNNTEAHTGVMSLFYIAIADVTDDQNTKPSHSLPDSETQPIQAVETDSSTTSFATVSFYVMGSLVVASVAYLMVGKYKQRNGYRPLLRH